MPIEHESHNFLPLESELQEGKFRIRRLLAHGSFGATYLAQDVVLDRMVVIKEFFPEGSFRQNGQVLPLSGDSFDPLFVQTRELFLKEAQRLARFHHSGIVSVHTFFEANNTAYMVMEHLEGLTLQEVLEKNGPLPPSQLLEIAKQLCIAIDAVHAASMLHRDIKPSNVICCEDGRIVLIDFGLSEPFEQYPSHQTRPLDTALRFGTPGYAPLEQYSHSAQLGPASDVHAVGATLYHLATGAPPPPATDRACGVAVGPLSINQPVLAECILWAMELQLDKRPANAQAFLERLNEADATLETRIELIKTVHAWAQKKRQQKIADRKKKLADADVNTLSEESQDDTGCMKIIFILYLTVWGFVAMVWFLFLFVRYVLVGS